MTVLKEQIFTLVHLTALIQRTLGHAAIRIGLIDGPVAAGHPDLASPLVQFGASVCERAGSAACAHGTFVAGILGARRDSLAAALCPACPLLLRPVFLETDTDTPSSSPAELIGAIKDVVHAGARIINLSLVLPQGSSGQEQSLGEILDWAAHRGVLLVVAAGNDGRISSTALTRHPWVIPVISCDAQGNPSHFANLSISAARHGLMAPGEGFVSLDGQGETRTRSGTSFATALVTGAAALLWSLFPEASAYEIKTALLSAVAPRRSVVPPLLDAERAYQLMSRSPR